MDMMSTSVSQDKVQVHSLQDQVHLVCECLLMAGAIKRHNEDAFVMMGSHEARSMADEMYRVIDGADGLLEDLENNQRLNALQTEELIMVWNKLRFLVSTTYQGQYFSSQTYN